MFCSNKQLLEGVVIDGLIHQQALGVLPLAAEGVLVNEGRTDSNYWCLESHLVNNTRRFSWGCPAAPSGSFHGYIPPKMREVSSCSTMLWEHVFSS